MPESIRVPVSARLFVGPDDKKSGTLMCVLCDYCGALVSENMIQRHQEVLHGL
jgi:hypothetical protein